MQRCYLIQDPYQDYAIRCMEIAYDKFGLRPICYYTDPAQRFLHARRYPVLTSRFVIESYDVSLDHLADLAQTCRTRHRVVGIIPYNESTVAPAAELLTALGLSGPPVDALRLCRNKFALKEHLRRAAPALRLNRSFLVRTLDDVARARRSFEGTFVLKPNDGFGNRQVAVFAGHTSRQTVAAYLHGGRPGATYVLEEHIDGPEYFVNGHVDVDGTASITAVFAYVRVPANGRRDLDYVTKQVHRRDPIFAAVTTYALAVVRALGLKRSPFHMEVKVDAAGPCLIDLGARLVGNGNAWLCNKLHGGRLDAFELAVHSYLTDAPLGAVAGDWEQYERTSALYVHGIATRREVVATTSGLDDVENLPAFDGWLKRPEVGATIDVTRDLFTAPYTVILRHEGSMDTLEQHATHVRELVRWNDKASWWSRTLASYGALNRRVVARAHWLATSTQRALSRATPLNPTLG